MMRVNVDLSDRYGTDRSRRRLALVGTAAAVAVVFLGWLAWVTWFHANPEVTSQLVSRTVVDDHTVEVVVDVDLEDSVDDANCKVQAMARDKATVGELNFVPVDGRNEVTVRTERKATAVELVGCTSDGQNRPR